MPGERGVNLRWIDAIVDAPVHPQRSKDEQLYGSLTMNAKYVALSLSRWVNYRTGDAHPKWRTILARTGKNDRDLLAAFAELETQDFLAIEHGVGTSVNGYRVRFPDEAAGGAVEAIKRAQDSLSDSDYALLADIAAEAKEAGVSINLRDRPTVRLVAIARMLIAGVAHGQREVIENAVADALGTDSATMLSKATLGEWVGRLTAEQAREAEAELAP
jgi:hypothetical protein